MIIYISILITIDGVKSLIDDSLNSIITRIKKLRDSEKNNNVIVESLVEYEKTEYTTKHTNLDMIVKLLNSNSAKL